jgi:fatty-acyl-CoA synthase
MYISGGENVYPAEVERVLRQCPGVEEVAVVGILDDKWGETGHAYITCKPGFTLTQDTVLSFCKGRLTSYKRPKRVTFCSDFPRTALGKIRKKMIQPDSMN